MKRYAQLWFSLNGTWLLYKGISWVSRCWRVTWKSFKVKKLVSWGWVLQQIVLQSKVRGEREDKWTFNLIRQTILALTGNQTKKEIKIRITGKGDWKLVDIEQQSQLMYMNSLLGCNTHILYTCAYCCSLWCHQTWDDQHSLCNLVTCSTNKYMVKPDTVCSSFKNIAMHASW